MKEGIALSGRYDHFAYALATGNSSDPSHVAPTSDNLKIVLLTSAYVVNLSTHQYLNDITGAAIVATSPTLTGVAVSAAGVVSSNPTVFTGVSAGKVITQMVMYKDTGSGATSPLMIWDNTASVLPLTTSGADIDLAEDPGPYAWYSL